MSDEVRSNFDASTAWSEFHAIGRAPSKSRATVEIELIGGPAVMMAEIGVGEPRSVLPVLQITGSGKRTSLPELLDAGQLVSVRFPSGIPVETVTVVVRFAAGTNE